MVINLCYHDRPRANILKCGGLYEITPSSKITYDDLTVQRDDVFFEYERQGTSEREEREFWKDRERPDCQPLYCDQCTRPRSAHHGLWWHRRILESPDRNGHLDDVVLG